MLPFPWRGWTVPGSYQLTSKWASSLSGFVADLGTGNDRLPLERVMRRHLPAFEALIADGRTWPQIARALTDAGARHRRGQAMCPKQLRTVYRRSLLPKTEALTGPRSSGSSVLMTRRLEAASVGPRSEPPAGSVLMQRLAEVRKARAAAKREFEE